MFLAARDLQKVYEIPFMSQLVLSTIVALHFTLF